MNFGRISALTALILLTGFLFAPALSPIAHAADPKDTDFSILPKCDPTKFPNAAGSGDSGPCGFTKFQELVVNVIKWLLYIIVPIGFCIVGWAGFKIMTSAGSGEAVQEAYGMIKIVATGIIIAALSYIIIVTIFKALNVQSVNFVPLN